MVTLRIENESAAKEYVPPAPRPRASARYVSYVPFLLRLIACTCLIFIAVDNCLPRFLRSSTSFTRSPLFTPILPPSYPLAVRTPYLSAWLPGSGAASLPSTRPQFWTGRDLTWAVIGRVNGKVYNLFGVPYSDGYHATSANVIRGHFTSTHSIFELEAGGVNFKLDFFSPVSPENYLRQSLPFSYLTVTASHPYDGSSPASVQIYSDIDESWTGTPENSDNINYVIKNQDRVSAFQLSINEATHYTENQDMALWGRAVWAARKSPRFSMTSSCGRLSSVRGEFARDGKLNNLYTKWRNGNRNGFPALRTVAAFSYDLGQVKDESSATFVIGHVRDASINYLGKAQTPYYRGFYKRTMPALVHFFDDYEDALSESQRMDQKIETAAMDVAGKKYADILALSLRQTFGGMELTIPNKSLDTSGNGTLAWIKENSSNGNINTVDIIYPAFPVFYILNPEWIRLLLEPLLRYLNKGTYPNPYATHDIGRSYPNATGHDDGTEEQMPIESTGNMIILTYAYTNATGNKAFYQKYYDLFQSWAEYLVENGLYPAEQRSTNDAIGPRANQTNLGIKAAVALNAWGKLTSQNKYVEIGKKYAEKIHSELGTYRSEDKAYFTTTYGSDDWFGPFNLYPDKLLGLNTFSPEAMQTANNTYVRYEWGVPLMGSVNWGKTDWQMFCAGAATEKKTRDMFVDDLHALISNGFSNVPFTDRYWCADQEFPGRGLKFLGGSYNAFRARPTLGAHFSLLALEPQASFRDLRSDVLFDYDDEKIDLK